MKSISKLGDWNWRKGLHGSATSSSSSRFSAIEDTGTDRGQRTARGISPRNTERDRALSSSNGGKRDYHEVVVEDHLKMEVEGGTRLNLSLFFFSIIATVMLFPFSATRGLSSAEIDFA